MSPSAHRLDPVVPQAERLLLQRGLRAPLRERRPGWGSAFGDGDDLDRNSVGALGGHRKSFHDRDARSTASLGVTVGVLGPTCPLPDLVNLLWTPRALPGLRAAAGAARPGRRTPRTAPMTPSRTPCRPDRMIQVIVVDNQVLVREGFQGILESQPDSEVVGAAKDGVDAVEQTLRFLSLIHISEPTRRTPISYAV